MSRIFMVSLAYVPSRIATECLKQVYKTIGVDPLHLVLHNHYPIEQELNDKLLTTLFDHYDCSQFDLNGNTGLSAGYNFLISQCDLKDDDIVIGLDLDCFAVTQGWGEALVKVLRADPTIAWASLQNQHSVKELQERGFTPHTVDGVLVHEAHQACVNSICAWSGKFLNQLGGLKEPNQFYGGLESISMPKVKQLGMKWVYLPMFKEEHNDLMTADGCYRHWKWNYAHLKTTLLPFDQWLLEDPSRLELK